MAAAYIRGAREEGLMTTGKHFPGHGDTETDSHIGLPIIRADKKHLDDVDLPPFRTAVGNGIDAIMTVSHEVEAEQIARLNAWRDARDAKYQDRAPSRSSCDACDAHRGQRPPHPRLRAFHGQHKTTAG